ncbi:MAG: hypothetical protein ABIF11_10705 [Nitrospirota bacterium]
MSPKRTELKELKEKLYQMCHLTKRMLDITWQGFDSYCEKYMGEAKQIGKEIDSQEKILTPLLVEKAAIDEEIKSLVLIPGNLERIGDNLESILYSNCTMNAQGILFSDKAIKELNFLFEKLSELIECVADCILTKNKVLLKHIREEGEELNHQADEFADGHEQRLVTGVCIPKSSPIYLDILDSLKEISRHIRGIAKVVELP